MKPLPKPLLEPWLITEEGMHRVVDVWSQARRGEEVFGSLEKAREEWKSRPALNEPGEPVEGTGDTLRIVDGIGVITIRGTQFRHANLISEFSGGCTYDSLWAALEHCRTDAEVKAVLLRIDSPGGEANGCAELADFIAKVAVEKPTWSYIEGYGCSAAYWLASQATRVSAYQTAFVGSIGARIEVVDNSAAVKGAGLRVLDMVSSGAPGKRGRPVDDDVLERIQTKLDDLEERFVAAVAAGRGVSTQKVYDDFGQGDYMIASKALAAGMVDELSDFNETLEALRLAASNDTQIPTGGAPRSSSTNDALRASSTVKGTVMSIKNASAKAAEDQKDPHEAEGDDPAMNEECEGDDKTEDDKPKSKKAKAKAEGESEEEADADEPAMDEDEDEEEEEGKHHEPDGDEAKARASLAALAGLKPGASLSQIAAVLNAKTQPLSATASLRKENAKLAARLEALEGDKHRIAAKSFVAEAIAEGRTVADKSTHLQAEFVAAEKRKPGSGPAALEPQLFAKGTFTVGRRMTMNGAPIGKAERPEKSLAQDSPEDVRAQFAARAQEIAKAEKISYQAATARVKAVDPELYAQFAALGR